MLSKQQRALARDLGSLWGDGLMFDGRTLAEVIADAAGKPHQVDIAQRGGQSWTRYEDVIYAPEQAPAMLAAAEAFLGTEDAG